VIAWPDAAAQEQWTSPPPIKWTNWDRSIPTWWYVGAFDKYGLSRQQVCAFLATVRRRADRGPHGDPAFVAAHGRACGIVTATLGPAPNPNERPELVPSLDRRCVAKNR
jgi:broad specificity phosphatase PhoE